MRIRPVMFAVIATILALALSGAGQQSAEQLYKTGLYEEEVGGDLQKAIGIFQEILKRFPDNREVAAKAQLHIGLCYEKLGTTEAEKAFRQVIDNYPEQSGAVREARDKLALLLKARSDEKGAGPEKTLNVRMIWSGTEARNATQVSPDGASLAFFDEAAGNLCIKEISSGKVTAVVRRDPAGKPYEFPVGARWSPDGKRLAYGWFNADNSIELRMVGIDGSNLRTLYSRKNEMMFPTAWSPDGRTIAVGMAKDFYKSYDIGLVSAEDGSLRILKTEALPKVPPKSVTFSPDGRFLLVDPPQKDGDTKRDIVTLAVDGTREVRVVEHPADDTILGWVPGSDRLLFLSDRTGTPDAWVVDIADGRAHGEPQLVRSNLGQISPLGITREGALIYSLAINISHVFTASIDLVKRTVIAPPKVLPQPLVGADHEPQWSPDGKDLAFYSVGPAAPGARGPMALKIRSESTGETRELKTNLLWVSRPVWAPDGRSLFVVGSDGRNTLALFQVQVETGLTTFLVDSEPGANIKFIAPARDGKSVFYTYFEFAKKRSRIMSLDLATRESRELYRQDAPPDITGLSVSPAGQELIFGTLAPGDSYVLMAIPLAGGPLREIIKAKSSSFGISLSIYGGCWTADGKQILSFRDVGQGRERKSELCSVPAAGGEIQGAGLVVEGSPSHLSLHPDGRRLAYAVSRSGTEIWVMENFLPAEKK